MDNQQIETIVQKVVEQLRQAGVAGGPTGAGDDGLFDDMEEAIQAAVRSQAKLTDGGMELRKRAVDAIRKMGVEHAVDIAQREMAETKMGKYEHKILKMQVASQRTPGVEDLSSDAVSGDHGLTVNEMAPFGVIGAITPVTHPVPTLINNAIGMISAGNSVVVNPHPNAMNVSGYGVQLINRAIVSAGGPRNLVTAVRKPTMDTGKVLFNHPQIDLLAITGGPGVVKAAMQSAKRAICAGPGNPPVVVDETADLAKAAAAIVAGATFDNNLLCIGEKEIIVVESVAEPLIKELLRIGCVQLSLAQMDQLADKAFENGGRNVKEPVVNRNLVGRDAAVLAKAIGLDLPSQVPMLFGETPWNHPWVLAEQMMPCLPLIRVADVNAAIDLAQKVEHGFRHTAIMHSKNVANLTRMGKVMNCTVFVKNGPSTAGLGLDGEGTFTHSIASPTGEGITTTRTWTRMRRCTMVDYLRII